MKKYIFRTIFCIGFCGATVLSQPNLQILTAHSKFTMNVSYSRFRYTNTETYLEINFAAYPSLTTLIRDTAEFKGMVDFQTKIRNTKTDSLFVNQQVPVPMVLSDTSSASLNRPFIAKITYALPVGDYTLDVKASDRLNTARKDSIAFSFTLSSYGNEPGISDVDLCSSVTESQNKASYFYKNSYEVIPNPSLFFGASTKPVIFTYAELYNLKPGVQDALKTQVLDGNGKIVKERARLRRFGINNAVDVSTFPTVNIASGKYKFYVLLTDSAGNKIASTEKFIYIYNPKVVSSAAAFSSAKSAELAGLSGEELTDEFRKARYIAYPEDIKTFDKLSTSDAKREFLAKFWTSVESGERGRTDMTRSIYMDRILTAKQRYRVMGKEGWRTDRGRVYILYAEPDDIQRFPNSDNSKPYEIWEYHQIENGVQFIFIDRSGFGDYQLVHSTKRGELQDESWQEQLR
ncbi:MAG: GWxTD domain-containing protein [Ignavibacteriae bacterium]|nr:MAG: GWxTD domain-containing protein [Ignavibacteriota bacterium]